MINTKSRLELLCNTYTWLQVAIQTSDSVTEFIRILRIEIASYYSQNKQAEDFVNAGHLDIEKALTLQWTDYAVVTIDRLIENEGRKFYDPNIGKNVVSEPLHNFWRAAKGFTSLHEDLLTEFEMLFAQWAGTLKQEINYDKLEDWMDVHPSGLDREVLKIRKKNKHRIIEVLVDGLMEGTIKGTRYHLPLNCDRTKAVALVEEWWEESSFHLAFAIRSADTLHKMMGYKLEPETLKVMKDAEYKGLPIFVNPYYLSLLLCSDECEKKADAAIRMYIFYSRSLVDEFGDISAWEKEDQVIIGEPNAAGWLLPSHNIHRRYPEVAILIPDTIGRACGGLCSSCQRMYGFQSGNFNFDLAELEPTQTWPEKLERLLEYYEHDTQLRDILITGGDALMSTNKSLRYILERTLEMIERKVLSNKQRNEKYAEISRIRLGTRLPVYLPQRVDKELVDILANFRARAVTLGVKQFVIQTHFESAMEITPEAKTAVSMLLSAGWYVTNQQVFTAAAALRGHTAKLRSELNKIGVLPYYTFSVKGFKENSNNFATNARIVQEMVEEKCFGLVPADIQQKVTRLTNDPVSLVSNLDEIRRDNNLSFLATDRSVINIPGVGKSLTFQTIGLTEDGRRILEFSHDANRAHSPAVDHDSVEIIIESKSISSFLRELEHIGEDITEYTSIYGYTICATEPRMPLYNYPSYDFPLTDEISNFRMPE